MTGVQRAPWGAPVVFVVSVIVVTPCPRRVRRVRPCGLKREDEDEQDEGPDGGPALAAELVHAGDVGDAGGGEAFGEAEDEAAEHGAVDVADAAEDGGGEDLSPATKPMS